MESNTNHAASAAGNQCGTCGTLLLQNGLLQCQERQRKGTRGKPRRPAPLATTRAALRRQMSGSLPHLLAGNRPQSAREPRADWQSRHRQDALDDGARHKGACLLGYKVQFANAATLASNLKEARGNYQLRRLEKGIAANDMLLLDKLSYARFNQEESGLLFKVITERSERGSTLITTNLVFSKWTEMFASDTLVAALVDRLTYRSHVLNMNGESYRLSSQQQRLNMS